MTGFVAGMDRAQLSLLSESLDEWVDESKSVFVAALDFGDLEFDGVDPAATGRSAYHPSINPKLCICGYLKSRAVEPTAGARSRPKCRRLWASRAR